MMSNRSLGRLALGALALAVSWLAACAEDGRVPSEPPASQAAKGGNGGGGGTDPTVNDTDPDAAPQDTTLDIRVFGTGFDQGSSADLLLDGNPTPKVRTNATTFVSDTEVVANVTFAPDATVDLYDVRVTTSRGKKGIGIELFAVKEGPAVLNDPIPFEVTLRDNDAAAGGDVLGSDGLLRSHCLNPDASCYEEGQEGVEAHLSGNGNLLFRPHATPRQYFLDVQNSPLGASGLYAGGIYTNTNIPDIWLSRLSDGQSVTSRLIMGTGNNDWWIKYGVDCFDVESGSTRVTVSRNGDTWTIVPLGGAYVCRTTGKGKHTVRDQFELSSAPFVLTLRRLDEGLD